MTNDNWKVQVKVTDLDILLSKAKALLVKCAHLVWILFIKVQKLLPRLECKGKCEGNKITDPDKVLSWNRDSLVEYTYWIRSLYTWLCESYSQG